MTRRLRTAAIACAAALAVGLPAASAVTSASAALPHSLPHSLPHAVSTQVTSHSAATRPSPHRSSSALPSEKRWREDVARAMKGSRAYLRRVVTAGGGPFAVNLDIDNTSLATYYRPGSPVLAVRAFARLAEKDDVAVMFNTGRPRSHARLARRQLVKAGFPVTRICGRARPSETLAHSKPRCRERFVSDGFTIIANVGNNPTDFSGKHDYRRAFRLPNYGGRLG